MDNWRRIAPRLETTLDKRLEELRQISANRLALPRVLRELDHGERTRVALMRCTCSSARGPIPANSGSGFYRWPTRPPILGDSREIGAGELVNARKQISVG